MTRQHLLYPGEEHHRTLNRLKDLFSLKFLNNSHFYSCIHITNLCVCLALHSSFCLQILNWSSLQNEHSCLTHMWNIWFVAVGMWESDNDPDHYLMTSVPFSLTECTSGVRDWACSNVLDKHGPEGKWLTGKSPCARSAHRFIWYFKMNCFELNVKQYGLTAPHIQQLSFLRN